VPNASARPSASSNPRVECRSGPRRSIRTAERAETKPTGTVRITAPPGLAFDFIAPFAAWLKTKLPDVTLEVVATIQYLDLSRRDADIALRFAAPAQRDVVTLATLELENAAFASPAYAKTLPKRPKLSDVAWIAWAPPLDHLSPNPELTKLVPGFRPSFASGRFSRTASRDRGRAWRDVPRSRRASLLAARQARRARHGSRRAEGDLVSGVGAERAGDPTRARVADALVVELSRASAKKR